MSSRIPFYFLISLLVVVGIALSWFRHDVYGVPWAPGETSQVWDVEARIQFTASGDAAKLSMAAPQTQKGFTLVDETASSPGYGIAYLKTDHGRRTEWSIRQADGPQVLYYKSQFLVDPKADFQDEDPTGEKTETVTFDGPQQLAAQSLLDQARKHSADNTTLTRELIKQFTDGENQSASLLLNNLKKERAISKLLSLEGIHNKVVGALWLEDGRRRQSVQAMIEIWDQDKWVLFNPETGEQGKPENLLIWDDSNVSLLDVVGGKNSQILFSMIAQDISPTQATAKKVVTDDLLNFSIHSLPIAEQSMFKTIMLIPIGALIVVFLRIIIGLKTSGTFMPVLIAVAFVQTQLITGIVGFLLIVGAGLIIRGYLSRLNLLLVARISAVIIAVIMIISVFTVVAFKIGLNEGLSITFFPMIILSWTVERMSILWEEEGWKEVATQGGGSLLTAVLIYIAMTNVYVEHLTFNFIGLQLVVLAVILMLGNYTGYRLTELRRFKPLAED